MPEPRRNDCPPHVDVTPTGRVGGSRGVPIEDPCPSVAGARIQVHIGSCTGCGEFTASLRMTIDTRSWLMPMTAMTEIRGGGGREA